MCLPHLGLLHKKSSVGIQVIGLSLSCSCLCLCLCLCLYLCLQPSESHHPGHFSAKSYTTWSFLISLNPSVNQLTPILVWQLTTVPQMIKYEQWPIFFGSKLTSVVVIRPARRRLRARLVSQWKVKQPKVREVNTNFTGVNFLSADNQVLTVF